MLHSNRGVGYYHDGHYTVKRLEKLEERSNGVLVINLGPLDLTNTPSLPS